MQKATRQQTKDHNTRLVLKTIFDAGHISRAEIARLTGLTRPTVSAIAVELLREGYIVEIGQGISAGGKPPTLIKVNPDSHRLLALDLSGKEFRGAVLNMDGRIDTVITLPIHGARGEQALLQVYRLLELLLRTVSPPFLGLGVATPGLVDPDRGIILRAVNLGWTNLPLRDLLADRYQLQTYLANDSHMAALAEFSFGVEHASENLIVIRAGQGIGAGIILDSKPFYGDGYGAGEVGHVVVQAGGLLCSCGNRGCLETISSTRAMLQAAASIAKQGSTQLTGNGSITWPNFVTAVIDHDPAAVEIAVDAGRYLGTAVANLVGAYNIHHVVLTGQIIDLGDILLDAVVAEMHQRVLPSMATKTRVQFTSLEGDRALNSIILGCSALIMQRELGVI